MTILISDMGDTVIASFKRGTFRIADWTVLPKAGIWRDFLEKHPWLLRWMQKKARKANLKAQKSSAQERVAAGFQIGPTVEDEPAPPPTLEELVEQDRLNEHALARNLAAAIRRTARDLKADHPRRYSYEEWLEFTRLIRFSRLPEADKSTDGPTEEDADADYGVVEWDWIGEESPLLSRQTESEWLLDRLCESLDRYMRKRAAVAGDLGG